MRRLWLWVVLDFQSTPRAYAATVASEMVLPQRSALALCALILTSPAHEAVAGELSIAVLPSRLAKSAKKIEATLVDESWLAAIQLAGDCRVIGRSDIDAMIKFEHQKDLLGCSDTACFVEIGGALGVDKVLELHVGKAGSTWSLTAKIIDVKQGTPVVDARIAEQVSGDEAVLLGALPVVARRLLTEAKVPLRTMAAGTGAIGTAAPRPMDPSAPLVLVNLVSEPPGAAVIADGQLLCPTTPCQRSLQAGTHLLTFQHERYLPYETTLTVVPGMRPVRAELRGSFGLVEVATSPPAIAVKIDGKPAGKSPLSGVELAAGKHEIVVADPRYYERGEAFVIASGEKRVVTITPEARQGEVRITAVDGKGNEVEADVEIDGSVVGKTPMSRLWLVGEYAIAVKHVDRGVFSETMTVRERQITTLTAKLAPALTEEKLLDHYSTALLRLLSLEATSAEQSLPSVKEDCSARDVLWTLANNNEAAVKSRDSAALAGSRAALGTVRDCVRIHLAAAPTEPFTGDDWLKLFDASVAWDLGDLETAARSVRGLPQYCAGALCYEVRSLRTALALSGNPGWHPSQLCDFDGPGASDQTMHIRRFRQARCLERVEDACGAGLQYKLIAAALGSVYGEQKATITGALIDRSAGLLAKGCHPDDAAARVIVGWNSKTETLHARLAERVLDEYRQRPDKHLEKRFCSAGKGDHLIRKLCVAK